MPTFSRNWLGVSAGILVLGIISAALGALWYQAPSMSLSQGWQDPYLLHITLFSLKQALLSTLLAVVLAIPVAQALFHYDFFGKKSLLALFSFTLVLPVLIGIIGLISVYGQQGLLAQLCAWFGIEYQIKLYGLTGILLAHVFFNLPFATLLLLQSLQHIPPSQQRLACQLGIDGWQRFWLLERPYLQQALPHCAGLIFMLCFTSFATVMTLGGGPQATTIEVAIYQAIRFDFDLQSGALLAVWQLVLCAICYWLIKKLPPIATHTQTQALAPFTPKRLSWRQRLWCQIWIGAATLFILPPLVFLLIQGINRKGLALLTHSTLWQALQHSLSLAFSSMLICAMLGFTLVLTARNWRLANKKQWANALDMVTSLPILIPSVVLSTGLFILLRAHFNLFHSPFALIVMVNVLLGLPYMLKMLSQPALQLGEQYQHLCASLGIKGIARLRWIEWQGLTAQLARALGVCFVLAMGDLGTISLIGSQDFQTLTFYLFNLMGSYQTDAATSVALLLLGTSIGGYGLILRLINRNHR